VEAEGPTELWCATVTEVVFSFANRHKRWYWFLPSWIWTVAFFSFSFGPALLGLFKLEAFADNRAGIVYLCAYLPLALLMWRHERIFPPIVVRLKSETSWVREFNPELTLALTVLSVIIAIVALFLG
jgi:hypothetical protein